MLWGSSDMAANKRDIYIVFGGSGFVGRHIVEQLKARGDTVSIFDIVQKYDDTPFYTGDITEEDQVADALQKVSKKPALTPFRRSSRGL